MKNEGKEGRRGGTWHVATIHFTSHMYMLFTCCSMNVAFWSLFFMSTYMTQLLTLHNVFCGKIFGTSDRPGYAMAQLIEALR